MYIRDELREKASRAIDKKGAIGPDIDLNKFDEAPVPHSYLADADLCAIPEDEQKTLIMSGLDVTKKERGGTYFQKDTEVIHCIHNRMALKSSPSKKLWTNMTG